MFNSTIHVGKTTLPMLLYRNFSIETSQMWKKISLALPTLLNRFTPMNWDEMLRGIVVFLSLSQSTFLYLLYFCLIFKYFFASNQSYVMILFAGWLGLWLITLRLFLKSLW